MSRTGPIQDLVVHVRGEVKARDSRSLTIGEWTLPTTLSEGVVTVSSEWPSSETCDRKHCGDECIEIDDYVEPADIVTANDVEDAAREAHDHVHPSPWRYCPDALCRAVREAVTA